MHRYLGLDIGKKRTGVALVDDDAKVATPLTTLIGETDSQEFQKQLEDIISEWEPVGCAVGLPIDLRGNEGLAATDVKDRTLSLMKKINIKRQQMGVDVLEVVFVDERMSTAHVEKSMKNADVNAKDRKEIRDALAAAVIAQSFIDTL